MDRSAYLDAMGIARWQRPAPTGQLSAEFPQALSVMFAHPLFASVSWQLNTHGIELFSASHSGASVPVGALQSAEEKRALWQALCRTGMF